MFTGIVEAGGTLAEGKETGAGFRVRIETTLAPALTIGDSLAVNGVCLTVILIDGSHVHADIGPEYWDGSTHLCCTAASRMVQARVSQNLFVADDGTVMLR